MTDSPTGTQDDLLDGLLSDFLDESDQLLAQLNENLLQLDEWVQSLDEDQPQRCDGELLNEMFRAAHSIKGLSAMLGLSDINTLTHKIENVLDAARNGQLDVNADVVDLVFMGLDRLTALVESLKQPGTDPVDCDAVVNGIRELLRAAGAQREKTSQADAERALADARASAAADAIPVDPLENLRNEEDISDKYLSIFIDEAELSLDELSGSLMSLEEGGEGEGLRSVLGTAHKLKGSAAAIGLNRVAKLAHLMEDLLEDVLQADRTLSAETVDVLLRCTGALQQYVADLKAGPPASDRFGELARELLAVKSGTSPAHSLDTASASLTECLERVVAEIRDRLQPLDEKVVASAAGMSVGTVRRVRAGENVKLHSLTAVASFLDEEATPEKSAADTGGDMAETADPAKGTTCKGEVEFQPDLPVAAMKAQLIYEKLVKLGRVLDCDPSPEQLDELDALDSFRFRLLSDQPPETIAAQIRVGGVRRVTMTPLDGGADAAEPAGAEDPHAPGTGKPIPTAEETPTGQGPRAASSATPPMPASNGSAGAGAAKKRTSESGQRPAETVRVDIDRLDQLMDLAGQLVINKAQFSQIGERLGTVLNCKQAVQTLDKAFLELTKLENMGIRLDGRHAADARQQLKSHLRRVQNYLEPLREEVRTFDHAREYVRNLSEAIHQLGRVSDGIQQGVMDTRMVPVGPLFARFKRVVRDITRANGKQVRLEIRGEKTELDKRMIDELGDPLVHMVRNSADHGIELPDHREAAGKPRQGTVMLEAFHRGNSIVIRVSDDGKGLDTERILRKCLDKGLLTEADAEKMSPHQIHQMIWEPGLSTAEKVTDVSGRGMGMDIVKSKIEDLNGTVDIESTPGKGTAITIKLPLTLAILPSLMVEIAGDVFAMPMEAVIEIVSVGRKHLSTVHGKRTALVRGRIVSVVHLSDALQFHRAGRNTTDSDELVLVIFGEPGREIGLAVDRVVGEEDIVIKSIAENYKNIAGIAGASILGDGRVSLILDTAALSDTVSQGPAVATGQENLP